MAQTSSTFSGPISDEGSRLFMKWKSLDTTPTNFPGPGNTKDSQWSQGTSKVKLYDITSTPWKNMQDFTFLCEFDSLTNLAPGPGGHDPSETPETDPLEVLGPNNPAKYYEVVESGSTTGESLFDLGTVKLHSDDTNIVLSNSIFNPTTDFNSGLYIEQFWLRIMDAGDNQGYYPIVSSTGNIITIDPLGRDGSLTSGESSLNGRIYRFKKGDGITLVNTSNNIQTDLQSGRYYAYLFIHSWPSIWNDNVLHIFKITPYYLIKSQLDSSEVVPVWSFVCKSIIQEFDLQGSSHDPYSVEFKEYWDNFDISIPIN